MNAFEARKLVENPKWSEEIGLVIEKIRKNAEYGVYSCTYGDMAPSTVLYLEREGYKIEKKEVNNYVLHKIDW
jgi:hypothetical protein